MAQWRLEGSCKQCGECCKALMRAQFMLDEKTGHCRYLEPDGSCQIRNDPTGVPKKHLQYWIEECKPYPNPEDPAHTPPRHELLECCGYRLVEVK